MYEASFAPEGDKVVFRDETNTIWEWPVASAGARKVFQLESPDDINSPEVLIWVFLSQDGRWLFARRVGDNGAEQVWNTATGQQTASIFHEGGPAVFVNLSRDGQRLVSGGANGDLKVWDLASGKEILSKIFPANAAVFSNDGRSVAAVGSEGKIIVWDVESGREITQIFNPEEMGKVAFSPDGRSLATVSSSGTLRTWLWQDQDVIDTVCARLERNLTRAEWNQYIGKNIPYRTTCPNLPEGQ